jgi:hypothetical protein
MEDYKVEIERIMNGDITEKENLKILHRKIEIDNAHKIIANQEYSPMRDVEFFVNSAIYLMFPENPGNWKLQLEAALNILQNHKGYV